MKRLTLLLIGCLVLGLTLGAEAVARDLGIVDMDRVLQESALGQKAQADLEARFGDRRTPLQEEEVAIRQLQASLERDRPLMSRAQVEKKEKEIADRIAAFEKDFSALQKEVIAAQQEAGKDIIPPAREAINAVAKEQGLAAVFEAGQMGALFVDDRIDITADVIKQMDASTQ
jgi:outer membrane protein